MCDLELLWEPKHHRMIWTQVPAPDHSDPGELPPMPFCVAEMPEAHVDELHEALAERGLGGDGNHADVVGSGAGAQVHPAGLDKPGDLPGTRLCKQTKLAAIRGMTAPWHDEHIEVAQGRRLNRLG